MTLTNTSFPKTARLRRAEEFRNLVRNSSALREGGVALYVLRKDPASRSRLGILVSRRALKRAVDRNRVKRVTRELFRAKKGNFLMPVDMIVRILDGTNLLKENSFKKILNSLFHRAKILNEKNSE
jgi:ribonuclease P protein component